MLNAVASGSQASNVLAPTPFRPGLRSLCSDDLCAMHFGLRGALVVISCRRRILNQILATDVQYVYGGSHYEYCAIRASNSRNFLIQLHGGCSPSARVKWRFQPQFLLQAHNRPNRRVRQCVLILEGCTRRDVQPVLAYQLPWRTYVAGASGCPDLVRRPHAPQIP